MKRYLLPLLLCLMLLFSSLPSAPIVHADSDVEKVEDRQEDQKREPEEEKAEKDAEPVAVSFVLDPSEASLSVYEKNAAGEYTERRAKDGSLYELTPGTYYYDAGLEEYESKEKCAFTVNEPEEGDARVQTVSITLTAERPEPLPAADTQKGSSEPTGADTQKEDRGSLPAADSQKGGSEPTGAAPQRQQTLTAPAPAAAQIGEQTYETLKAAVEEASDGDEIRLLQDVDEGTAAFGGGALTLDLNGHVVRFGGLTLSGAADITLKDSAGGGALTLTGAGEKSGITPNASVRVGLTLSGAAVRSNGVLLYSTGSGSSAVITGGTITCAGATANGKGCGAIGGDGIASVTISGGKFTVDEGQTIRTKNAAVTISGGSFKAALEVVREASKVTISGGSFIGGGSGERGGTKELFYGLKSKTTITGGFFQDDSLDSNGWLKDAYLLADDSADEDGNSDTVAVVKPTAAKYNGTKYASLGEALADIPDTETEPAVELYREAESTSYQLPEGQTLTVRLKNGLEVSALDALKVTVSAGYLSKVPHSDDATVVYSCVADPVAMIGDRAFASLEDAANAASDGDEIRLLKDVEEGTAAFAGGALTLDLNGHDVSFGGFTLSGAADITLKDSAGGGTLTLTGTGEKSGIAPNASVRVGLTLDGATVNSNGVLLYSKGSGSSADISGGTITCAGATANGKGCGAIGGDGIASVTISGDTFTVDEGQTIRTNNAEVTISGGSFKAALEIVRAAKKLTISGGSFVGDGTSEGGTEIHGTNVHDITISGGFFKSDLAAHTDWIASGYTCLADGSDGDDDADTAYTIGKLLTAAEDLVYNGGDQALLTAAEGASLSSVSFSVDGGENWSDTIPTGMRAGTYTVTVKYPNGETEEFSVTIARKALTVTAAVKSKTYGETDPALTYTAEGLVDGDSLSGALERDSGESVGTYAITQGTLAASDDYSLSFTGAELTIARKALTVTAAEKSKTYGEMDPALTYTAEGLVDGDSLSGALERDSGENAGIYAITQGTLAASDNYTLRFTGAELTIAPRSATVTADDKAKDYGTDDPELTAAVTGLLEGDELVYTLSRASGEDAGEYRITVTLGDNPNYAVTTVAGTFTIRAPAAPPTTPRPTPTPTPTPAPARPARPAAPAAPTANAGPTATPAPSESPAAEEVGQTAQIDDTEAPLTAPQEETPAPEEPVEIAEEPVPQADGAGRSWSLLDLILTVVCLALAGVLTGGWLTRKRRALSLLGLIPAALGVVILLLTQSFRGPMHAVDAYTPILAVMPLLNGLLAWFTRGRVGKHSRR